MKHRVLRASLSIAALAMLIAQPLAAVQARTRASAGFQGTISFYAQTYKPTKSMVVSSTNTHPRRAIRLVADAWEKMHPGVHIKFVDGPPPGTYYTWARTVLTGESAPDIMWWQTDPKFTDNGKIVQLDKWLSKPNPYNPGGGKWIDTFQPPYKVVGQSPNHHYGWVPMDLVSTGIYYNKAVLKKAGLNPNNYKPATWAQWMKDMATLKSKGVIPFCSAYVPLQWWGWGSLGDQLLWRDIKQYDVLRYQPNKIPGTIDEEEMVRAVLRGGYLPSKDEGFRELMRVMKDWSPYWCGGWSTQSWTADYQLFVTGKLAFLWEGTWTNADLRNDPRRNFDIGTFYLPPITKETSSAAKDPPIKPKGVGGYGSLNYAVTKTAVNDGSVNLAVDFLQYLTTPNSDSLVVNEQPQFVVAVKGAPDKSGLTKFFEGEKAMINGFAYGIVVFGMLGQKWQDKVVQISTEYIEGQRSLDSAMKALDDVARTQAQNELLLNDKTKNKLGTWDTTKW